MTLLPALLLLACSLLGLCLCIGVQSRLEQLTGGLGYPIPLRLVVVAMVAWSLFVLPWLVAWVAWC